LLLLLKVTESIQAVEAGKLPAPNADNS